MVSSPLHIYGANQQGNLGLSLRGRFRSATDIALLDRAVRQLLAVGAATIWADCRYLEPFTWQGQRALLHADRVARELSSLICWCGLPAPLEERLHASGLFALLQIGPATQYQGPRPLLLATVLISPNTFSLVGAQ